MVKETHLQAGIYQELKEHLGISFAEAVKSFAKQNIKNRGISFLYVYHLLNIKQY